MTSIITKTKNKADLAADLKRLIQPLGGISNFVKPGDDVLLKPNFNTADPFPASTSLDFLEAVVNLIKTTQPKKIILADSCTISQKTATVLETLGVPDLCQRLGIELMNFDQDKFIKKQIGGQYLKSVNVPAIIDRVNKIITLPCLKTHRYARFTISLKIAMGLVKKLDRLLLHAGHLEEKLAELNLTYRPDLIIVDGRKAFVTNGPESGQLVEPNLLMAGTDRVAIDVEGIKILQTYSAENNLTGSPWEQPQIKRAVELGLGAANDKEYQLTNC